jgi:hypothetical protein
MRKKLITLAKLCYDVLIILRGRTLLSASRKKNGTFGAARNEAGFTLGFAGECKAVAEISDGLAESLAVALVCSKEDALCQRRPAEP